MTERRIWLGLVIDRGSAVYGHNHGLWLPLPLLTLIARAWNHVACRILGHDDVLWHLAQADVGYPYAPECTACLAPLTACVGRHHGYEEGAA